MRAPWQPFGVIVIISLLFNVSTHASETRTTKYINMNAYTLTSTGDLVQFDTMVVNNEIIAAVGNDAKLMQTMETVDLKGANVLPGLIDAHGHILGLGANLLEVDLRGASSEEAAVKRVLEYVGAASNSDGAKNDWIIGRGWNQVLWPSKSFPTKDSLDKVIKDRPVYLSRVDGHAGWVNSKALELAGITRDTMSPSGGEIVKDEYGEPTGLLIDNAEYLINKVLPKASKQQYETQLNTALNHLVSLGITSAHDAGVSNSVRNFYIERAQANKLKVRIYAMLSATDPQLMHMLKQGHFEDANGLLSIRSVKAYGDGALGSRGAALLAPYSDAPDTSGLLVTAPETLPSLFNNVIGANFQLNFHAIGDKANRLALQQFAKTFVTFPENAARHRIEHAQVVALEDIPLFKEYGVIPSMQPTHATSDMNMAEDRVGKARLKGAYAWQTFLSQGTPIAFGSDFPVELANVFHGLHAAVTRQNAASEPSDGWISEERVSRVQALKGFTVDAAYAAFQENMIGSLEVGKRADFIITDKNYFSVDESEIRNINVLATYVNGQAVFTRN
ncbi:MAG: amidohydrolase [Glaciecola sp.]